MTSLVLAVSVILAIEIGIQTEGLGMLRFWSIGGKRRGWSFLSNLKRLPLRSQLRFLKMKELTDKQWLEDDTAKRIMGGGRI